MPDPILCSTFDNVSLTLRGVKEAYSDGRLTESEALFKYAEWVKQPTWVCIPEADHDRVVYESVSGSFPAVRPPKYMSIYHFFLVSKRGNDIYLSKVRRRFIPLWSNCRSCIDVKFLEGRSGIGNVLFITLTYDTSLCSKQQAYNRVGSELNVYLSDLKRKFGRIKVLRCFETFPKSGYPHIHMIVEFLDHKFRFSHYTFKTGKQGYIISSNSLRKKIEDYWHSYASIQGVRSVGAVTYLLKYITKDMYADSYNTVSHLWLYHKQSYSMSNNFMDFTFKIYSVPLSSPLLKTNSNIIFSNPIFLGSFDVDFEVNERYFVVKDPPADVDLEISNGRYPSMFRSNFKAFYEAREVSLDE